MLEIKNLCFSAFDGNETINILNNIDLTVKDGTFLVLTGPNGGGKTTLTKLLLRLYDPTNGDIMMTLLIQSLGFMMPLKRT